MEKIFLPPGKLKILADRMGTTPTTASKYLRGFYDAEKEDVANKAEKVREEAIKMGGAFDCSSDNSVYDSILLMIERLEEKVISIEEKYNRLIETQSNA